MNDKWTLAVTSSLSILLVVFHLTEDIVRGFEPGKLWTLNGCLILAVWLFGTLALAGRRSGYVVVLVGSLFGVVVSAAHMRGAGLVGGRVAGSEGRFFWVFTIFALGVTSIFSVLLSARGVWGTRRRALAPGAERA